MPLSCFLFENLACFVHVIALSVFAYVCVHVYVCMHLSMLVCIYVVMDGVYTCML